MRRREYDKGEAVLGDEVEDFAELFELVAQIRLRDTTIHVSHVHLRRFLRLFLSVVSFFGSH